jgi:hypothetical protein
MVSIHQYYIIQKYIDTIADAFLKIIVNRPIVKIENHFQYRALLP